MIPGLGGWKTVLRVGGLLLVPPEGPAHGRIEYHERRRPLARLADLVARHAGDARVVVHEALVTDEGEHAALVSAAAAGARHELGFLFGDDFYALVHGVCLPEHGARFAATVRALLLGDSQALGVRRRRYKYRSPRGWQGLARGQRTDWYPLDYPRRRSVLSVLAATPTAAQPVEVVENQLELDRAAGFTLRGITGPIPVASAAGLAGERWEIEGARPGGPPLVRDVVVLRDEQYVYPLFLESAPGSRFQARSTFDDVMSSVEPIPAARRTGVESIAGFWTE